MSQLSKTSAPKGRTKLTKGTAQGVSGIPSLNAKTQKRRDAASTVGRAAQSTSSPEGTQNNRGLPKRWKWSPLGKLSNVVRGGSPRPAGDPRYFGGDIPWITVGAITAEKTPYLREVKQTVTAAGKERSRFVEPGTLLLTNSGATLGVPKITLIGGCINDGVAALLDVPESLKLYLLYFLQTQTERLRGVNQGAAQPNLNTTIIKDISVPLAPSEEQRGIVAEIEKQFTRLEAGVAALRRVQANLKRYRAAVLKAACEGRLVPTEAERLKAQGKGLKDFESGEKLLKRILTQRRQNWHGRGQYKEPIAADTTKLGPLPTGWVWARLEQLGVTYGGLTKNPKRTKLPKQLPYLRVANVYANELRLDDIEYIGVAESELDKLLVRAGDLLIVEGNGSKDQIGRLAIWDGSIESCVHQNHLIKVRPVEARMPKWILHWLQSPGGRQFVEIVASSTSGLFTLSVNKVGNLVIPLPPLAEQTRIVAEVERRLSVVEELEAVVIANLQRATRLRQSILQKAVTGTLISPE